MTYCQSGILGLFSVGGSSKLVITSLPKYSLWRLNLRGPSHVVLCRRGRGSAVSFIVDIRGYLATVRFATDHSLEASNIR